MEIMTEPRLFGSDDREPYVGPQPVRRKFGVGQVHIFTVFATHGHEAHSLKMDREGPEDAGLRSVPQGGGACQNGSKRSRLDPIPARSAVRPLTLKRFPFMPSRNFMHLCTKPQCGRSAPLRHAKSIHNP